LREVLGASGEEWLPAPEDRVVRCRWAGGGGFGARIWTELMAAEGAEAVAVFEDGDLAGHPAVLRHRTGEGVAWYVATVPEPGAMAELTGRVLADAGVRGVLPELPRGVEAVRRGDVLFLLNHGTGTAHVPLPRPAHDLLTGSLAETGVTLEPRAVVALRPID
jgi:beta-galactosidase